MNDKAHLKVREAAEWLNVAPSTVYQWVSEGRLPAVRMGRCVRLPREALERWVDARNAPSDNHP